MGYGMSVSSFTIFVFAGVSVFYLLSLWSIYDFMEILTNTDINTFTIGMFSVAGLQIFLMARIL